MINQLDIRSLCTRIDGVRSDLRYLYCETLRDLAFSKLIIIVDNLGKNYLPMLINYQNQNTELKKEIDKLVFEMEIFLDNFLTKDDLIDRFCTKVEIILADICYYLSH